MTFENLYFQFIQNWLEYYYLENFITTGEIY